MWRKVIITLVSLNVVFTAFAEDEPIIDITGQLGNGLIQLQDSAQKLSAGNILLAAKINDKRMKISQLQLRLKQLANENNALTKDSLALQESDPQMLETIASIEKKIFEVDAEIEKINAELRNQEEQQPRLIEEDKQLTAQMQAKGIDAKPVLPKPIITDVNAKEKLRLLKMIEESKLKQQELYAKLVVYQRSEPKVTVEVANEQQMLEKQIIKVQEEINQLEKLDQEASAKPAPWDAEQMKELEAQVKLLQKNATEFEGLLAKMQEKHKNAGISAANQTELTRLAKNLENLQAESKDLKVELNALRRQMVDLDKRKTYLESLLAKK